MGWQLKPHRRHIVSGSEDTTFRLWDAASGAVLHILEGNV
jgi:WD40 repeat protein